MNLNWKVLGGRQWEDLIPRPSEDQGGTSVSEETFPVYRLEGGFENLAQGSQEPQLLCQESKQEEPRKELRGQEGAG